MAEKKSLGNIHGDSVSVGPLYSENGCSTARMFYSTDVLQHGCSTARMFYSTDGRREMVAAKWSPERSHNEGEDTCKIDRCAPSELRWPADTIYER